MPAIDFHDLALSPEHPAAKLFRHRPTERAGAFLKAELRKAGVTSAELMRRNGTGSKTIRTPSNWKIFN
jgi:hypothetical protein